MQRLYQFLFVLLILSVLVQTQFTVYSQGFNGGILLGANASQVDGDGFGGYHKPGIMGGLFVNTKLKKKAIFQVEMKYFSKGSLKNIDAKTNDMTYYSMKLHYVEMPVMLSYPIHYKNNKTRREYNFLLTLGIAGGYLVKSKEENENVVFYQVRPFYKYEVSGIGGIGIQLSEHFTMSFDLHYSLLKIRNHPGNERWFLNSGQFNNVVSFTIYYSF